MPGQRAFFHYFYLSTWSGLGTVDFQKKLQHMHNAYALCYILLKYSDTYESLIFQKLWDQSIQCFGYISVLKLTDYSSDHGKEPGTNDFELMSLQVVCALLS